MNKEKLKNIARGTVGGIGLLALTGCGSSAAETAAQNELGRIHGQATATAEAFARATAKPAATAEANNASAKPKPTFAETPVFGSSASAELKPTATVAPATSAAVLGESGFQPAPLNDVQLDNMPKVTVEEAPLDQWIHRVIKPELFHAPDWAGADSWGVSFMKPSRGLRNTHLESHNVEGQIVGQFNPGFSEGDTALGVWVNAYYRHNRVVDTLKRGTQNGRVGQYNNKPIEVDISTDPGVQVCVVDANTFQIGKTPDGKENCGSANWRGDIGIIFGDKDRAILWARNLRDETKRSAETRFAVGVADDPDFESGINHLHVSQDTHPITNYKPISDPFPG